MRLKRPTLSGIKHTQYLGHFAQDRFIREGHNTVSVLREEELREALEDVRTSGGLGTNAYEALDRMNSEKEKKDAASESQDDSGKSSNYSWETTVKNGKRSHRLIRGKR